MTSFLEPHSTSVLMRTHMVHTLTVLRERRTDLSHFRGAQTAMVYSNRFAARAVALASHPSVGRSSTTWCHLRMTYICAMRHQLMLALV